LPAALLAGDLQRDREGPGQPAQETVRAWPFRPISSRWTAASTRQHGQPHPRRARSPSRSTSTIADVPRPRCRGAARRPGVVFDVNKKGPRLRRGNASRRSGHRGGRSQSRPDLPGLDGPRQGDAIGGHGLGDPGGPVAEEDDDRTGDAWESLQPCTLTRCPPRAGIRQEADPGRRSGPDTAVSKPNPEPARRRPATCSAVLRVRRPRTDPSWTAASTCRRRRKNHPGTPSRIARASRYGMEDFWTTVGQAAPRPNPPLAYPTGRGETRGRPRATATSAPSQDAR
jgi:hypothetical protein